MSMKTNRVRYTKKDLDRLVAIHEGREKNLREGHNIRERTLEKVAKELREELARTQGNMALLDRLSREQFAAIQMCVVSFPGGDADAKKYLLARAALFEQLYGEKKNRVKAWTLAIKKEDLEKGKDLGNVWTTSEGIAIRNYEKKEAENA